MNRRQFNSAIGAALLAQGTSFAAAAKQMPGPLAPSPLTSKDPMVETMMMNYDTIPSGPPQQIGMLIYPGMYSLDLVGPYSFLSGLMNVEVHLLWKTLEPVDGGKSLKITPTTRLSDCPRDLDVLFVPGGTPGTIKLLEDDTVLDFLSDRGSRAKYVTSVCTGSLVLGGAGLLKGYRATSHWNYRDVLPVFGAIPVKQRIVEDRNRITGGGVTSGIDFGLVIASRMRGERYARMMQLALEYDPHPPFVGGTPDAAGPALTHEMQYMMSIGHSDTRQAAVGAVTRRKLG